MSYESYKLIHLAAIFVFLSGASVLLLANPPGKQWKMITGIASLVILIAGMAMLGKGQWGFPAWAQGKLVLWLTVTGLGHVVAKRFPAQAVKAYWVTMLLAVIAAGLAVFKP